MPYNPQQSDIELLKQSKRVVYSKIELLDKTFKTVGEIDGETIEDSYSIDAESDIRITYNLKLIIKNSSLLIGNDKKIWFDKYIRIYTGLFSLRDQKIIWYPIGVFLFESAGYFYDTTTNELSLSCADRMSELIGSRNGKTGGLSLIIPAGSDIREAMLYAVVQLGNIEKYKIEDIGKTVPYDLEFGTGSTVYDIIRELRDLYPGWETYFDDEHFIYHPYPTCSSDPIVLDTGIIKDLIVSEVMDVDFRQVYNVAEVWGGCLETDYYTDAVTYSRGTYNATYVSTPELSDGSMFGFKACSDNLSGSYFNVIGLNGNAFGAYPILIDGNDGIDANRIISGLSYVVKFVSNGIFSYFYFCGQYQVGAVVKLVSSPPSDDVIEYDLLNEPTHNITYVVNPDSPFTCDLIGEIRNVYSGADFESIYSEDLASQRGRFEIWKTSDLLDSITLQMIEVPWLTVNQKIEYTSNTTGKSETYIVKSKTGSSTGGVMTINCVKFQPLYYWTL